MPPWYVDKTVGIQKFANDRSLSDHEIDLIRGGSTPARRRGIREDLPKPQSVAGRRRVAVRRVLRASTRLDRQVA